jgi:fucose permease
VSHFDPAHFSGIHPQWKEPLKRCLYAFTVFYNPALMTTKMAILILYYRMATAHLFLRYASLATMVVVIIAGIVLTFLNICQCHPISAGYSDVDGTCIDIIALYLSSAPINVLTDLAILLLPLPILTSLRMEFRQKLILVATFIVGGFVTIVDVVRIVYLQEALKVELEVDPSAAITATTRPPNFTYHVSFSLMWSAVEVSVGIICCCVLVLKPLVMRIMPRLLHPHHRGDRPSGTPESLSQCHISKDLRPRGPVHIGILITPLSDQSIANQVSPPISPRVPDTGPSESLSSPRPHTVSSIPEQPANEEDEEGDMDFFEMLASDPPHLAPPVPQSPVVETHTRRKWSDRLSSVHSRRDTVTTETSQAPTQNFFDFVSLKGKVPLTQLSAREAWWAIMFGTYKLTTFGLTAVSILFFLWGFGYGVLGTLNSEIQSLLGYSPSQTLALHNAYWAAYFFGPLMVGYWVLKHAGFKATFMTGLAIYATGAMSFWPSSILRSFPGFFISNFIIAVGLSCLEVAANPFIALAGPGELSEARLNFAQGIQGIGSIISPILVQKLLFTGINQSDLFRVQWCYLAVALFVVFLTVIFFYVPLSEASDDDLEAMALQRLCNANLEQGVKAFGLNARRLLLWTGVALMWIYVGLQEPISYFWSVFVQDIKPGSDTFWDQAISHAVMAFGRFLAAGLCYFGIPPRITLATFTIGAFLTSLLAMVLHQGSAALAMLILIVFFEAPIFPTLFAMILRGQGKHTKFASAATTMAISGGALWPSVVYAVERYSSNNGLVVVVVLYGVSNLWPAMISSSWVLRRWVDPVWSKRRVMVPEEQGQGSPRAWNTPVLGHEKAFTSHLETVPWVSPGAAGAAPTPSELSPMPVKPSLPVAT